MTRPIFFVLPLCWIPVAHSAPDVAHEAEIIIYGGTSGGVAAAIQARKMGKSVILIEPTKFLGGLTTGGLGATDIGNKAAIGGLSREFYHRIWQHYQNDSAWTREPKSQPGVGETRWTFEPHVASQIYIDWIREAGVTVVFGERLNLKDGVKKDGSRITSIVMESGAAFAGKVFIDAGYEGDLMARAGVSYFVGREANSVYGETLNGVQMARATKHQFIRDVDPYVIPGDPQSGVLPGIQLDPAGPDGSGDRRVQAYNFRLCTTDVPENRLPWPKPAGYDPMRYELLLRNFEAGDLRQPWNPIWMPNRKTDTNNNFAVSTDNLGMNYEYPDGGYATRARIIQEHVVYTQGLLWTLANSPRVPESVRSEFQRLGPAADEFADNDHWPRQLYIREARRMISDYVMSEKNCLRHEVVEDSVGMGAYNMDSHNVRRHLTADGKVRNEGDIQFGSQPYPISYRSIRPNAAECSNLLAPMTLSASHIAFGSIRMEPVFMVLGQSAATAAALAVDGGTTVQNVDYPGLKARLLADQQVLDLIPEASHPAGIPLEKIPGIVVDDSAAVLSGFTHFSTSSGPFAGQGYAHDGYDPAGTPPQKAVFQTTLPAAGRYTVSIAWSAHPNRATKVPVKVTSADGTHTVRVNQRHAAPVDGLLFPIGVYDFAAGPAVVEISNEGADGYVIIDAVQWMKAPE